MPVCHTPVMPDMPMELTHMVTTERDLLMLSQRLMLMLTTDTTDMPDLMPMVTDHTDTQLMVTTERDLLMLSQRLMLMLTMVSMDTHMLLDMPDMPMELTHMPMVLTTDMPDLMPMDMPHMLMVLMEVTGDKLNATQLR